MNDCFFHSQKTPSYEHSFREIELTDDHDDFEVDEPEDDISQEYIDHGYRNSEDYWRDRI